MKNNKNFISVIQLQERVLNDVLLKNLSEKEKLVIGYAIGLAWTHMHFGHKKPITSKQEEAKSE